MPKHQLRALTLVELLVVVAIIVVLAAVMAPTLGPGLRGASASADAVQLRQIHVAMELYAQQENGLRVVSTQGLVWAGQLDRELVQSRIDPTDNGYANQVRLNFPRYSGEGVVPWKDSYTSLGDLSGKQFHRRKLESRGGGWLIAHRSPLQPTQPDGSVGMVDFRGTYWRLTDSGGVVIRRHGRPGFKGMASWWPFTDDESLDEEITGGVHPW